MKTIISTATLILASALASFGAGKQPIVTTGAAVSSDSHCIVVGEAAAGTLGDTSDWHVTAGQLQGIADVREASAVGTVEAPQAGYSVYPNPVRDLVVINRPSDGEASLTVTALNGALMLKADISSQHSTVDLSELTPGAYILTVAPSDGKDAFSVKIIKL